jgi:hypothetical protein
MSRDTILADDAGVQYSYDNIKTQGYLEGQTRGAELVCGFIRKQAAEAFGDKHDEKAHLLRNLVNEIDSGLIRGLREAAEKHSASNPETLPERVRDPGNPHDLP